MDPRPPAFPVHPGGLLADTIRDRGTTSERLAAEAGISLTIVEGILGMRSGITANVAIRLGLYFGTSPEYWLTLQGRYELDKEHVLRGDLMRSEVKPLPVVGPIDNGE